ncbi:MAG: phosphoribosylanthranilate isomerase [Dysgonamonadaceae bacterium]|jgi:phosphoribosylanthranilate isomerase|nr:phosphoribosylanthranilate isomerase [Dysgonamonadaceae bacterium]
MKIKVCGMCDAENIRRAGELPIDFMGFIFYPPSPRFAGNGRLQPEALKDLPPAIRKTGVYVSEAPDSLFALTEKYAWDAIQLHGNETPEYCGMVKEKFPGITLIKAFPVATADDFSRTLAYETVCDFFLFDSKTAQYGGSGRMFDWKLIDGYPGQTPFFLSGGIAPDDAGRIRPIGHPLLYGVDLNSRFETAPGIKNIRLLQTFIETLKQ